MDWITWLQQWGSWFYPMAFFWAFFEGETFVIFGGMASKFGVLNLELLIVTVWLGSFCGDQLWFWLGRKWGRKALDRFPAAQSRSEKVLVCCERYGVGFILAFRFLYGVRNIASVALGTSAMPWRKFLMWNFVAAGIWAVSFAGAGYMLGEAAARLGETGPKILVGVLVTVVAGTLLYRFATRHRRRAAALAATLEAEAAAGAAVPRETTVAKVAELAPIVVPATLLAASVGEAVARKAGAPDGADNRPGGDDGAGDDGAGDDGAGDDAAEDDAVRSRPAAASAPAPVPQPALPASGRAD